MKCVDWPVSAILSVCPMLPTVWVKVSVWHTSAAVLYVTTACHDCWRSFAIARTKFVVAIFAALYAALYQGSPSICIARCILSVVAMAVIRFARFIGNSAFHTSTIWILRVM